MGVAFFYLLLPFLVFLVVLFAVAGFVFGRMFTIFLYKKKLSKSIFFPVIFLIFAVLAQFVTLQTFEPLARTLSSFFFGALLFAISVFGKIFLYVFLFFALLGSVGYIIGKNIKKHKK